jgi:hypothetical protein
MLKISSQGKRPVLGGCSEFMSGIKPAGETLKQSRNTNEEKNTYAHRKSNLDGPGRREVLY